MQNGIQNKERGEILEAGWCYILGLDAIIKIPLLIFIPLYMALDVIYGAVVSKELTPLWIFVPLVAVLYIKMMRGLFALYVFSFHNKTVEVVKELSTYYLVAYSCIARGKLKEEIRAHLWQPVVEMKNLNYKELWKRKIKELKG